MIYLKKMLTDNPNNQSLISACYIRVSTARQEQEATVESQLDEVKRQIGADGNILPPENVFIDDGWSGELIARPSLDQMRDAAKENRFQALYVYDRGRLSRIFAHQEIVIEELTNLDIKFVTLHDVQAETPEEKVLQAMQGVFHQYEKIKIFERFRRGKLYKAKSGILINGHALYGYTYIHKSGDVLAHYVINEEEAEVVRMIFKWIGDDGLSIRQVIKKLYDLGIPPRKRKSQFWTKGPIVRILRNEVYSVGTIYYNKSEAVVSKHPINKDKYRKIKKTSRKVRPKEDWIPFQVMPLLEDPKLFEVVNRLLDENQKYASRNRKYDYLLAGKTFCECGAKRVGDGYEGNRYYRCADRVYKFPLESPCKSPGVNAVILDMMFWHQFSSILSNPDTLKEKAQIWLQNDKKDDLLEVQTNKFEEQVEKVSTEEARYAKAYGSGALDFEVFKNLMKELKRRKITLQNGIITIKLKAEQQRSVEGVNIDELCQEAGKIIQSLDQDGKKKVIRDIVERITIWEGGKVEVQAALPLINHNMVYEPISRDSEHGTTSPGSEDQLEPEPTFSEDKVIPFQFTVKMPTPRYYPLILKRDEKGRIIDSKFPEAIF